MEKPFVKQLID